ncbi:MAG: A/G-specific adenine glycosylase [Actinomycetaceae bacterium]|nr:A/G-specific adenine glycosylase [Actinomycetaceae bacterium]
MFTSLIDWYTDNARPLPWRDEGTSPWAILVCEVMSQQTPVSRVIPAWTAWLERWATPEDLAGASTAEVLLAWNRLGYPRRALRLRDCAAAICEKHGGQVPRTREELLALPGIGEYTADAILTFAYHRHCTLLDTNIRRVLARLQGYAYPPPSPRKSEREYAASLVPSDDESASQWNGAIMELGSLVCTASKPRCEQCPLASWCSWLEQGKPENVQRKGSQGYKGTHREARGKIMAALRNAEQESSGAVTLTSLRELSGLPEERFSPALSSLLNDSLVEKTSKGYRLPH